MGFQACHNLILGCLRGEVRLSQEGCTAHCFNLELKEKNPRCSPYALRILSKVMTDVLDC